MQKILVIDDDQDILDLLCFNLERAGIQCISALDGTKGLELAFSDVPDLIVLDIMMPGFSGIEVLKKLKYEPATSRIPVVMLTAKGEEVDRVIGLELGAEDYVTKPFSVRELVLRIEKILRRFNQEEEGHLFRCNGITLDSDRYEVRVKGASIRLTTTEFNLLAYLLRNKGRVLSRDRLLEHVWGYRYGGTTRTVDTHIQRLREKLGTEADCIETIRGVGYKLESGRSETVS
jgi:two-component system phosphate regulon response regulator PhoB